MPRQDEAPQFREIHVSAISVGETNIPKVPGDSLGATIYFDHKGAGGSFKIGLGLACHAYPSHNPPFQFIYDTFDVDDHTDWASLQVEVSGILQEPGCTGVEYALDVQKFICWSADTLIPGQQPPNPFGTNDWDANVYLILAASRFQNLLATYW